MHRIDGANHLSNTFQEGPPVGTQITSDWLNDVQEAICDAIETAGITLVKGTDTQLTSAILAIVSNFVPTLHLIGAGGEPAFGPAWQAPSSPYRAPGFYKNSAGEIVIIGDIEDSGSHGGSLIMFTLPAGSRPAGRMFYPAVHRTSGGSITYAYRLFVDTNGEVSLDGGGGSSADTGGAGGVVNFGGIRFQPGL